MESKQAEKILEESIEIGENMLQQENIVCPFCGQVLMDKKVCDCDEAVTERKRRRITTEALENTLPMLIEKESCKRFDFEPINNEKLLNIIRSIIKNVGYDVIQKVTIKVDSSTQFAISNKDDYIEIQRKENTSKVVKLGG